MIWTGTIDLGLQPFLAESEWPTDERWWGIAPVEVPTDRLCFVQETVNARGLIRHAETPNLEGHTPPDRFPRVVLAMPAGGVSGPEFWVLDGMTRAILAIVRGQPSVFARVWNQGDPRRKDPR